MAQNNGEHDEVSFPERVRNSPRRNNRTSSGSIANNNVNNRFFSLLPRNNDIPSYDDDRDWALVTDRIRNSEVPPPALVNDRIRNSEVPPPSYSSLNNTRSHTHLNYAPSSATRSLMDKKIENIITMLKKQQNVSDAQLFGWCTTIICLILLLAFCLYEVATSYKELSSIFENVEKSISQLSAIYNLTSINHD